MSQAIQQKRYLCFVHWLWFMGLTVAGVYLFWDIGVLPDMIRTDQTYISVFILLVFAGGCAHSGLRSWQLSKQANDVLQWRRAGIHPASSSPLHTYLDELNLITGGERQQLMAEWLGEKLRGPQQAGWFISGTLIKLGLLGTVVGFVIMLGSLGSIESLEPSQVQILMEQMTRGMGIALNTTLLGLTASMILGVVYLFLDRTADGILAATLADENAAS